MNWTSFITALRRIQGYKGSAASFRRVQRSVNGVLTGMWSVVSGAIGAVFGKGAGYG